MLLIYLNSIATCYFTEVNYHSVPASGGRRISLGFTNMISVVHSGEGRNPVSRMYRGKWRFDFELLESLLNIFNWYLTILIFYTSIY